MNHGSPGGTDFQALFHGAPAGYLVAHADGVIIEANDTICAWTGRSRDELFGASLLELMPAGDRFMFRSHATPTLDATGGLTELSVEILGPGGTRKPVLLSISRSPAPPAPADQSAQADQSAAATDRIILFAVPERRLYERELAHALRKLEETEAERTQLLEDARHRATHDELTGLPNRRLLEERIDAALQQAGAAATRTGLLFCDVNGFKHVNDTLGHAAGDTVLQNIAGRLRNAIRTADTAARYSGDEFVVVVPGLGDPAELDVVAGRIHASLEEAMTVEGETMRVSLSVGRAISPVVLPLNSGLRQDLARRLLAEADLDMYRVKKRIRRRGETRTRTAHQQDAGRPATTSQ
ncbi:putative signaling protein [Arthrobacter sp. SO5]|uniref:sensor domain-containing protein n=1 Tax=Arthrobacter sp. SO5 TaxID=1897055 RepID=UPI001E51E8F6|nr:sensor domain-containing diguanylate cyclase [Arthrobacter sp. SO5]MCB5273325.1 putative signaling protein [Arthrobacter sp. SO5]